MVNYDKTKALKELVLEKMNEVRFLQERINEAEIRLSEVPQELITEGQRQDNQFWKMQKSNAEKNLPNVHIQLNEALWLLYKEEPNLFQ